jgi:hypothetical protein
MLTAKEIKTSLLVNTLVNMKVIAMAIVVMALIEYFYVEGMLGVQMALKIVGIPLIIGVAIYLVTTDATTKLQLGRLNKLLAAFVDLIRYIEWIIVILTILVAVTLGFNIGVPVQAYKYIASFIMMASIIFVITKSR